MKMDDHLIFEALNKGKSPTPNTIKAQQLLDQAVGLIIKASNLPNVNWDYSDEDGQIDLQNALENIKDYVQSVRAEDEETPKKAENNTTGKEFVPDYQNGPIQHWEHHKKEYLGKPEEKLPNLTNLTVNNIRNIESFMNTVKKHPIQSQTDAGVKIAHMIYTLTWNAAFALQHAYNLAINGEKMEATGQLGPKATPDNTAVATPTTQNLK